MPIVLTNPEALWWLAAVPAIWLARRWTRTNFNPRQQWLQAAVRSLLVLLLAGALAQPALPVGTSGSSVVYLVDVSHSVASTAVLAAADRIDALNAALRPEHVRILAFGAGTAPLADTAALRQAAASTDDAAYGVARDTTDLERALDDGRAELQPGRSPRLVIFSDGRETAGDARAAALRLGAAGIPVFTEALQERRLDDAWVDGVYVPGRLVSGALVPVVVEITSQQARDVTVRIAEGERVLASRRLRVAAGSSAIPLDVTFDGPGTRLIRAGIEADGDPLSANDTLAREVVVDTRARVLYVEGQPASARYLAGALTHAGFDVSVRDPRGMPGTLDELEPWDVVVLSDVARRAIPTGAMAALGTWVEREGGGLLVAGGVNVFGVAGTDPSAGYRHSELERLLPVTFERNDDPEVALVIVLDRSWSMAGQVMALAKAAAQGAIDVLGDQHLVGVISFNDGFQWDVRLQPVGPARPTIRAAVGDIEAAGYTVMHPGMEQAYEALRTARARAKHLIVMSDGKSSPGDFEGLVRKMAAADITVSTVAVGPTADGELLASIAKWGSGRAYTVLDARQLAQVFVTEARTVTMPALQEDKPVKTVVRTPAFLKGVDLTRVPDLRGRIATVLKEDALEVLSTDAHDPLLSFWPIGLGRTAVFASDVKDRWAANWVRWPGYGPLFSAVVHALERPRAPALEVRTGVTRQGVRPVTIAIEARDPFGAARNLLKPVVRVSAGPEDTREITVRQVGPGRYETTLIADARAPLTVGLLDDARQVREARVLPTDPAAEYRFRTPDVPLLQAVASSTGGVMEVSAAVLGRSVPAAPADRRALWPWLVAAAILCWLGDVVLRRVRLFERIGERIGERVGERVA